MRTPGSLTHCWKEAAGGEMQRPFLTLRSAALGNCVFRKGSEEQLIQLKTVKTGGFRGALPRRAPSSSSGSSSNTWRQQRRAEARSTGGEAQAGVGKGMCRTHHTLDTERAAGSGSTCTGVRSRAHVHVRVYTTGTYKSVSARFISNHVLGCRALPQTPKMPI